MRRSCAGAHQYSAGLAEAAPHTLQPAKRLSGKHHIPESYRCSCVLFISQRFNAHAQQIPTCRGKYSMDAKLHRVYLFPGLNAAESMGSHGIPFFPLHAMKMPELATLERPSDTLPEP